MISDYVKVNEKADQNNNEFMGIILYIRSRSSKSILFGLYGRDTESYNSGEIQNISHTVWNVSLVDHVPGQWN